MTGGMVSVWVGSEIGTGEPQDVKMESRKNKENRRVVFCIAVFYTILDKNASFKVWFFGKPKIEYNT